jgi:hypothetical protein
VKNADEDTEKRELPCTVAGNPFLKKLKIDLSRDTVILLPDACTKEIKTAYQRYMLTYACF